MNWDTPPDKDGMIKVPVGRNTARRIKRMARPGETENDTLRRALDMNEKGHEKDPPWAVRSLESAHAQWPAPNLIPALASAEQVAAALQPLRPDQRVSVLSKAEAAFSGKGFKIDVGAGESRVRVGDKQAVVPNDVLRKVVDEAYGKTQEQRRQDLAAAFANPVLQRLNESCWHKVQEAWRTGNAYHLFDDEFEDMPRFVSLDNTNSFVVQHDWAAAFEKATDFEGGEYRLPYENQVFEFRISDRRVCVSVAADAGMPAVALLHLEHPQGWILSGAYTWANNDWVAQITHTDVVGAIMAFCGRQIRAISIALEAKVATTDIVRAPYKLNIARERKGKAPLLDYHVVVLTRRVRAPASLEHVAGERAKVRLHFRRGHWRHYEKGKTWINWMLVGDPELGFIDKHYRL